MQTKGKTVQFEGEDMKKEGKILEKEFKLTWTVKECFKKGSEKKTLEQKGNNFRNNTFAMDNKK